MSHTQISAFFHEFVRFATKQAWAALFGIIILTLQVGTYLIYPEHAALARYDFLVTAVVLVQIGLLYFRLETPAEAGVIFIYHFIGTIMEIFKVSVGAWHYPGAGLLHVAGVPLFSGFMYAAVGSYIFRAWRLFDVRFTLHPPVWTLILLSIGIYANFFTHHYIVDLRYALFAFTFFLFWRTQIHYHPWQKRRSAYLLLVFCFVALLIWLAENIGTYTKIWIYPSQRDAWHFVAFPKIGSWFLLMIISYMLVAILKRPRNIDPLKELECQGKSDTRASTSRYDPERI
jgi:uncharacterized membrane protein YoaT (DUF817 family)